jgi:MFS family permease
MKDPAAPYALPTFLLCLLGVTISSADQALFSFAIPGILKEFGIGLDMVGLILSISFGLAAILVVPAGMLADRLGRRWLFGALLALSAFSVGCHALAATLPALAAFRIVGFALSAGLYPIANTLVIEAAPLRLRGLMSGALQIGYPLGFFVASLIAAPLISAVGWRATFYPAFAFVPIAFFIAFALREPVRDLSAGTGQVRAPFSLLLRGPLGRTTITCLLGSFFVSLAIGTFSYFLPTFLEQARGVESSWAVRMVGISYAIGVVGYLAAAATGEYVFGRRNTLVLWMLLGALGMGMALWLVELWLPLMLLLGLTVMFLFGTEAVRMPLIGESFPAALRATATSGAGSVGVTLAWLIAPPLVALLVPRLGWTLALTMLVCVPLVLSAAIFATLPLRKPGADVQPA